MADRVVPDLFRLDGKVAVVTGASSGLGVAFARAWPRPGRTSRSVPAGWTGSPTRPAGRGRGSPRADGRDRRRRTTVVHRPGGAGHGGVRPGRHPGQQRRHRHGDAGHPRDARPVPQGHRRQPQRLLLDGPGLRPGDAAGLEHHQHQLGARHHDGGPAAGGVRRVEGRPDRADPRPGPAVDRPQGHPGQRGRAGVLRLRDDRAVPARLPRVAAGRIPAAARATRRSSRPPWCSWPRTPRATSPARRSRSTAA